MRHRLFHAIVIVGAASGCGSGMTTDNPPAPEVDSAVARDTSVTDTGTVVDSATSETTPDAPTADSAKPDTFVEDTCVDEGCGCMPCIK